MYADPAMYAAPRSVRALAAGLAVAVRGRGRCVRVLGQSAQDD